MAQQPEPVVPKASQSPSNASSSNKQQPSLLSRIAKGLDDIHAAQEQQRRAAQQQQRQADPEHIAKGSLPANVIVRSYDHEKSVWLFEVIFTIVVIGLTAATVDKAKGTLKAIAAYNLIVALACSVSQPFAFRAIKPSLQRWKRPAWYSVYLSLVTVAYVIAFIATLAAYSSIPAGDTGLVKRRGRGGRGGSGGVAVSIDHQAIVLTYVVFDIFIILLILCRWLIFFRLNRRDCSEEVQKQAYDWIVLKKKEPGNSVAQV